MLHARPSHIPWPAHTYIRRRVDIMTDLCTMQPFTVRLLLPVLVDVMLFLITPLSITFNHTRTKKNCVFYTYRLHAVFEESQKLCVEWIQYLEADLWLWVKMHLFFTSSTCHAFKYFTGLSMSRTRHGCGRCFVITLMTDAEPNSSRLSESRPFPTPSVWKWSGGFCSVVKGCVCSVFRYVGRV
jgi:hypothetical protein